MYWKYRSQDTHHFKEGTPRKYWSVYKRCPLKCQRFNVRAIKGIHPNLSTENFDNVPICVMLISNYLNGLRLHSWIFYKRKTLEKSESIEKRLSLKVSRKDYVNRVYLFIISINHRNVYIFMEIFIIYCPNFSLIIFGTFLGNSTTKYVLARKPNI